MNQLRPSSNSQLDETQPPPSIIPSSINFHNLNPLNQPALPNSATSLQPQIDRITTQSNSNFFHVSPSPEQSDPDEFKDAVGEEEDLEYLRMLGDTLTRYRTVSQIYSSIQDATTFPSTSHHVGSSSSFSSASSSHSVMNNFQDNTHKNSSTATTTAPHPSISHQISLTIVNQSPTLQLDSSLCSPHSNQFSLNPANTDLNTNSPISSHTTIPLQHQSKSLQFLPIADKLYNTDLVSNIDSSKIQLYDDINPSPPIQHRVSSHHHLSPSPSSDSPSNHHQNCSSHHQSQEQTQQQNEHPNQPIHRTSSAHTPRPRPSSPSSFDADSPIKPSKPQVEIKSPSLSQSDISSQTQCLSSPIVINDSYFSNTSVSARDTKHPPLLADISTYGFSRSLGSSLNLAPTTFTQPQPQQQQVKPPINIISLPLASLDESNCTTITTSTAIPMSTASETPSTPSASVSLTPSSLFNRQASSNYDTRSKGLGGTGYKPRIISSNIRPSNNMTSESPSMTSTYNLLSPSLSSLQLQANSHSSSFCPVVTTPSGQMTPLQNINSTTIPPSPSIDGVQFSSTPKASNSMAMAVFGGVSTARHPQLSLQPSSSESQRNLLTAGPYSASFDNPNLNSVSNPAQLLHTLHQSISANEGGSTPGTPTHQNQNSFTTLSSFGPQPSASTKFPASSSLLQNQSPIFNSSSQRDILIPKSSSLPLNSSRFLATLSANRTQTHGTDTFAEYEIVVIFPPLTWNVWRRYSEFEHLYSSLLKCPEFVKSNSLTIPSLNQSAEISVQNGQKLPLPKMPPKKVFNRLSKAFISDRQALLTVWWDNLMQYIDVLLRLRPFLEFVGMIRQIETDQNKVLKHIKNNILYVDILLQHYVQEGDVILFHTQGLLQTLQRGYLRSSYDHVGVVVRIPDYSTSPDSLYLFESTTDGVQLYPLKRRLAAWNETGAYIAYRQLICERTHEMRYRLYHFVLENEGKGYSISTARVWRNKYMDNNYRMNKDSAGDTISSLTINGGFNTSRSNLALTDQTFSAPSTTPTSSSAAAAKSNEENWVHVPHQSSPQDFTTPTLTPAKDKDNKENEKEIPDLPTQLSAFPTSNISTSQLFSGSDSINVAVTSQYLSRFIKGCDFDPPIQSAETYFCSELVAFAWLAMQIISTERPASSYLPASFSDLYTKTIPFDSGIWLEQECLITFKAPEITQASLVQLGASTQNQMYAMSLLQNSLLPQGSSGLSSASGSFTPVFVPNQPPQDADTVPSSNLAPITQQDFVIDDRSRSPAVLSADSGLAPGPSTPFQRSLSNHITNKSQSPSNAVSSQSYLQSSQIESQNGGKSNSLFKHQRKQVNLTKSMLQQLTPSQQDSIITTIKIVAAIQPLALSSAIQHSTSQSAGLPIASNAFASPHLHPTPKKIRGKIRRPHKQGRSPAASSNHSTSPNSLQSSTKQSSYGSSSGNISSSITGNGPKSQGSCTISTPSSPLSLDMKSESIKQHLPSSLDATLPIQPPKSSHRAPFSALDNTIFVDFIDIPTTRNRRGNNEANVHLRSYTSMLPSNNALYIDGTESSTFDNILEPTTSGLHIALLQSQIVSNQFISTSSTSNTPLSTNTSPHFSNDMHLSPFFFSTPNGSSCSSSISDNEFSINELQKNTKDTSHSLQSMEDNDNIISAISTTVPIISAISTTVPIISAISTTVPHPMNYLDIPTPTNTTNDIDITSNEDNHSNNLHNSSTNMPNQNNLTLLLSNSIYTEVEEDSEISHSTMMSHTRSRTDTNLSTVSQQNDSPQPVSLPVLHLSPTSPLLRPSIMPPLICVATLPSTLSSTTLPTTLSTQEPFTVIDIPSNTIEDETKYQFSISSSSIPFFIAANPNTQYHDFCQENNQDDANEDDPLYDDDEDDEDDDQDYHDEDCHDEDCQDEDCQDEFCGATPVTHTYDDIDAKFHSPCPINNEVNPAILSSPSSSHSSSGLPQSSLEAARSFSSSNYIPPRDQSSQSSQILSDPSERPKINPFLTRPQVPQTRQNSNPNGRNNDNSKDNSIFVGPTQRARQLREKQIMNKQKFQNEQYQSENEKQCGQNEQQQFDKHRRLFSIEICEATQSAAEKDNNTQSIRVFNVQALKGICICGTQQEQQDQNQQGGKKVRLDHKERRHVSFCPLYDA